MFKRFLNTKDKKRLFSNFVSLSILQGANYILPLITLPYLVRVLGPEKFGLIMFAQAFIQYFKILTDYGFNLSATREISIYRENKEKVSEIFSSVIIIKFGLLILSLIIMTIIVFSFEKFRKEWLIFYLTFGIVVGQVLFPIWFFQGMEKMKYITFLNITTKLIFTVSIFIFVREVSDYIYVPLINSIGFIFSGILAIVIIFKKFDLNFKFPSINSIIHELKEGWNIFISTIATGLYSNTFILGLFTNNTIVGYYSAYEKLVRIISNILTPFFQAIYPYICKVKSLSVNKAKNFLRKTLFGIMIVSISLFIITVTFPHFLIKLILGNKFLLYINAFYIMAMLIIILPLSYFILNICLLAFKLDRYFPKIYLMGGITNVILLIFLLGVWKLSIYGVTISLIITELLITFYGFLIIRKFNIL